MKNDLIVKSINSAGGIKSGSLSWWRATISIRALKVRLFGPNRIPNASNRLAGRFTNFEAVGGPVCLICNTESDLHEISNLAIDLELDAPRPGSLIIHFGEPFGVEGNLWQTAIDRLKHVPAMQCVYLVTHSVELAKLIGEPTGLDVLVLSELQIQSGANSKPTIQKKKFSPFACVITALWGGTGSTLIFDAQTEYLLARNYFVCRVFVEHWPKPLLASKFIDENFQRIRPHIHLIAIRTENGSTLKGRSSVGRTVDALSSTTFLEPGRMQWVANRTQIVLVNHTAHIGFAKKNFTAPCILETHDIMSDLYDVHGIPSFADGGPDNRADRWLDEKEAIAQAEHCVCLSHADYAAMRGVAKSISVVRPYANPPQISGRSFQDILVDNDAPKTTRGLHRFDLILWGDWHRGNVSSSIWFFDSVYPRLAGNDLQIAVAGRLCEAMPGWIKKLEGVHALGRVDNLHDFMNHSTIMVIYDKGGSGISIKAMETLAAGKAFVGTMAGMRQIDLETSQYNPSGSEKELADDILRLTASTAELEKRQQVSVNLYIENFSKKRYEHSWDNVIASVVNDQVKFMK